MPISATPSPDRPKPSAEPAADPAAAEPVKAAAAKAAPAPAEAAKPPPTPTETAKPPPTPTEAAKPPPTPTETAKPPPTPTETAKPPPTPTETAIVRYRIRHITRYDYGEQVPVSHHLVHLSPRPHPRQRCRRSTLTLEPAQAVRADQNDYFGNPVSYFAVQEPHRRLSITSEIEIEISPVPALDWKQTPPWEELRESARALAGAEDRGGIGQYSFDSTLIRAGRELLDYATPSFPAGRPIGVALLDLNRRIHREFVFDPTATTTTTPLLEVLTKRRGVCQDFAHLSVGCLRSLGLPARYVSGYLRTLPPPGQPRLVGADVSHAWVSAWCGRDLWVDLCPTNGRAVDSDFVTLAWGRDFDDVSPVRGVILGGAHHTLRVSVDVEVLDSPATDSEAAKPDRPS